ncbi:MAG: hypothetical protein ACU0CO_14430 [Shimia sp.]
MGKIAPRVALPKTRRRYRPSLTPLADAMFLLLVYFMFTTNLTPFSLLGLRAASDDTLDEALDVTPRRDDGEAATVRAIWTLAPGRLTLEPAAQGAEPRHFAWDGTGEAGGGAGPIDDGRRGATAPEILADPVREAAGRDVLITLLDTAAIRDLAFVLEAVEGSEIASVSLDWPAPTADASSPDTR